MPNSFTPHPDAVARQNKKDAADVVDQQRKQDAVNTNLRKQALAEVKETIAMMRDIDPAYTITADGIATMVDDRVARMKAGQ